MLFVGVLLSLTIRSPLVRHQYVLVMDTRTNQKDIEVGRNTNLTDTGGVDTGRRPRSYRLIIALAGFLIVAGVVTAVVIVSSGDSSLSSRAISCKEDSLSATPMQINACLKLDCTFDLSTCGENCPFGYELDESGCEYNCECAGKGLFEGDISFSENDLMELTKIYGYFIPESDFSLFSGSAYTGKLWTDTTINGRHKISYEMSSVTPKAEMKMREAMQRFEEETCIDFVERTNEDMYFIFASGGVCGSIVGKYEAGQEVTISRFCEDIASVQHELLHMLGFYHEQSRPDRDSYVIIYEDNMLEGMAYNFKKRMESEVKGFGSEYDVTSVMHYSSGEFSKNGRQTIARRNEENIATLDSGNIPYQTSGFTKRDLYELNALYNCLKNDDLAEWSVWTQWSDCDKTCGNGEQTRNRNCLNGEDLVSGCEGEKIEKSVCQAQTCPSPEGVWSSWGDYGECSNDCGSGVRWRERTCTPEGACEGLSYTGDTCDSTICATPSWGLWTTWTDCTSTCGGGRTARKRLCKMEDGTSADTCDADSHSATEIREKICNTRECGSAEPTWGMWTAWSSCSETCGEGSMTRRRECYDEDGTRAYTCNSDVRISIEDEEMECNTVECISLESSWGMWTTWSSCNETCGTRRRQCYKTDGTKSFSCDPDERTRTDVQEKECINTDTCASTDHCEFTESGICYWSNDAVGSPFTFDQAQQICTAEGSVLAYFPTELAYTSALTNLRSKMGAGGASAFTGIKLDVQSSTVIIPDADIYTKWYPGYPSKCRDCTNVYLYVMKSPYSSNQGMWNTVPTFTSNAVVCQKNQN